MNDLTVVILHRNNSQQAFELIKQIPKKINQILVIDDESDPAHRDHLLMDNRVTILVHPLGANFAAQRNWALNQVHTTWSLFLDSDEQMEAGFFQEVIQKISNTRLNGFYIRRFQIFLNQTLKNGDSNQLLLRLAKTDKGLQNWNRGVHETWQVPGLTGVIKTPIYHYNCTNLSSFIAKLHYYASLEHQVRSTSSFTSIFVQLLIFPPLKFGYLYILKGGFRDGFAGLVHAGLMSYYSLIVRIYVYETFLVK